MSTLRSVLLATSLSACIASGSGQLGTGTGTSGGGGAPTSSYGGPAEPGGGGASTARPNEPGEPRWDDFAFAVRERSGSYNAPWVFTKLTTFKVGKACYAKLAEQGGALDNSPYYVRGVLELAKKWTGDDWDAIENQRGNRARDRALVEPMMDAFAQRFHMTIAVEGDDCENERDSWWIRYWFQIGEAIAEYPPASGKLEVFLDVTAAARDVSVQVDETGSKFVFTAPRDFEARDWSEKLEKPFRKHAKKL
jgi:hypothetical protein